MSITIGIDVGGTKIAAGAVSEDGEMLAYVRKPTPAQSSDAVVDVIAECIDELARSYEIEGIGIGAAGFVNSRRDSVIFAPNLAWRNEPLAARVGYKTKRHVIVENDANAAAWAEFRFGAAKGTQSAAIVTVGTGIGGGIIINNELIRGTNGFGAEIGHMRLVPDGRECGCGLHGCWEVYASGNALVYEAKERARNNPEEATKLLELADGNVDDITGPMVTRVAEKGDPVGLACFEAIGSAIGVGLANLAAALDPEIFVLAGGVCETGDLLLAPVRKSFDKHVTAPKDRPAIPITVATLGNDAGIIGAADLARH